LAAGRCSRTPATPAAHSFAEVGVVWQDLEERVLIAIGAESQSQ
jgi:hypothetical protein